LGKSSRLRRIPVDTLKIDRAFISHMESDPESRKIVRIIIMLARNLGLKVVAEGTETEAQITLLKQLNLRDGTGIFVFSTSPRPDHVGTSVRPGVSSRVSWKIDGC
jgi:EAL domain-containing protein (putative c-di-GMP-specific phosphodiesterase class I)